MNYAQIQNTQQKKQNNTAKYNQILHFSYLLHSTCLRVIKWPLVNAVFFTTLLHLLIFGEIIIDACKYTALTGPTVTMC